MYIRFAFIIVAGASLNFSLSKEICHAVFSAEQLYEIGR